MIATLSIAPKLPRVRVGPTQLMRTKCREEINYCSLLLTIWSVISSVKSQSMIQFFRSLATFRRKARKKATMILRMQIEIE